MNHLRAALAFSLTSVLTVSAARAADPWPAEPWQQSTVLTALDPEFQANLSGAHWNDRTRSLWVCTNSPGHFWKLDPDGMGSFAVASAGGRRGEWDVGGDLESITQANDDATVYVLVEGTERIKRYDVATLGTVRLVNDFNIAPHVPAYANSMGSEGLTFVPDAALSARGFVDQNGQRYTSRGGLGGLMFVAHQNGGALYAFDLNPANNGVTFVGRYDTARTESSGLEFDRSTNHLYIWHNTGSNFVEVTDLTSSVVNGRRRFTTVREFVGPKGGNLEGLAFTPAMAGTGWYFAVDDSNQNGAALMWFQRFDPGFAPRPPAPAPAPTARTVEYLLAGAANDAEQKADGSVVLDSSDVELVTDGSAQVVGLRFTGVQVPPRAEIIDAWLRFTVDEVTNEATNLTIRAQASGDAPVFTNVANNIGSRATTTASVGWAPAAWAAVDASGAAQQTPDLAPVVQELVNRADYRVGNSMAFVIRGSGRRTARSCDRTANLAPRLVISYVEPPPAVRAVQARVVRSADDAEQRADGTVNLNSTDLELIDDGGVQTVGLRFEALGIPAGARIVRANIQFAVDEVTAADTRVTIRGQSIANAPSFTTAATDLSRRTTTAAAVAWTILPWAVEGEAGAVELTPDLSPIVQQIVNLAGYAPAGGMVFLITGAGKRTAEAWDGDAARAPLLRVEYSQ